MASGPRAFVVLLAGALALAGCGGDGGPRWIPLARGFRPQELEPLMRRWQAADGLDPEACVRANEHAVDVTQPLPRAAWTEDAPGTWSAPRPRGAFSFGAPSTLQLVAGDLVLAPSPPDAPAKPGVLREEPERIVLHLPPGQEPPREALLRQQLFRGRSASDGTWTVFGSDLGGAGIPVWSGTREELALDLPPASRFACSVRFATSVANGPVTVRVLLDGVEVLALTEDAARLGEGRDLAGPLPPRGGRARLALAVEGPPGQAQFLQPVVGPADFGAYGARPWREERPDVVLFLADTFRADNLAVSGGAPEVAPNLNRFAEGALRFSAARSNAAWTLPSIATVLSGLAPGQHTANETDRALPFALDTFVETLARAGWRTGAVTDAAFFTPTFGLDQGFEWFEQRLPAHWDLDRTVERALDFLDHDDGRPVFLVVHSYRTHMPYRTGPEESLAGWEEARAAGCALFQSRGEQPSAEWRARLASCRARLEALYRDGAQDLDRGFGLLLDGLASRGLRERAWTVFTSDHGEALGENDDVSHGGDLWDAKLRVPLLVAGPGLAPRAVDAPVTLLDLVPTLAEITGLPPDPRWRGSSLLAADFGAWAPATAFRLQRDHFQVTLVDAGRKLSIRDPAGPARGAVDAAFDLAEDPGEEHDVSGAAWAGPLAREHAAWLESLLRPEAGVEHAPTSPQKRRELEQLGYGGESGD